MRLIGELSSSEIASRLQSDGLGFHVGPYTYNLSSNLPLLAYGIERLYPDFRLSRPNQFYDFRVALTYSNVLSRLRGKADFLFDHLRPFGTIPDHQAYAFMEWGMNWCVSEHVHEYLKLHAGVVAKNGTAIVMPGVPGAGKSTLCAALALTGWRVLSDEHALIPPGTVDVVPLCRPVSLKNESIQIVKSFDSSAIIGPISDDTHKGTVAHMKADLTPDSHDPTPLPARIMLFPRFSNEDTQRLSPRRRTKSFILAAYHSFNYSLMGEPGFQAMKTLIDNVECYDLVYRDLDWALRALDELHHRAGTP